MSNKSTRNRDPQAQSRDPVAVNRDPKEETVSKIPRRPGLICVPEIQARCPKCSNMSRITNTRRYVEKNLIVRYRECVACFEIIQTPTGPVKKFNRFASLEKRDLSAERFEAVQGVDE